MVPEAFFDNTIKCQEIYLTAKSILIATGMLASLTLVRLGQFLV